MHIPPSWFDLEQGDLIYVLRYMYVVGLFIMMRALLILKQTLMQYEEFNNLFISTAPVPRNVHSFTCLLIPLRSTEVFQYTSFHALIFTG